MTDQIWETLKYEGEEFGMYSLPLADYLQARGESLKSHSQDTACYRGYVGTWEIEDDRLFLVNLSVETETGESVSYLGTLFPGSSERVFADWFTDAIKVPQGKKLGYTHPGYVSVYERDLFIEFDRGVVTRTCARRNVAPKRRGNFRRFWDAMFPGY